MQTPIRKEMKRDVGEIRENIMAFISVLKWPVIMRSLEDAGLCNEVSGDADYFGL